MCDKSSKRFTPSKISFLTSSLKRFGSVCYAACGWAHCGWLQAAETPGESAERSQAKQGDRLQGGHAATGKQQVWRGRKASLRPRGFVCMKEVSDGASVSPQVGTQHGNEKLPGKCPCLMQLKAELQAAQACKCQNIHLPDWTCWVTALNMSSAPCDIRMVLCGGFHQPRGSRQSPTGCVSVGVNVQDIWGQQIQLWVTARPSLPYFAFKILLHKDVAVWCRCIFSKSIRHGMFSKLCLQQLQRHTVSPSANLATQSDGILVFLACLKGRLALNLLSAHRKPCFFNKGLSKTLSGHNSGTWGRKLRKKMLLHRKRRVLLHSFAASQHK